MRQYQSRNRGCYLAALAAIFVSTVFAVILQFFKGDILDAAIAGKASTALRCIVLLLIFILCESVFYYIYALYRAKFVTGCTGMLKRDIFKKVLQHSYVSFQSHPLGWYVSKYTNEADAIQTRHFQMMPQLFEILFKIIFVSAGLFCLDVRVAVFTLVLLTLPLYLPKLIEKQLQNAQSAQIRSVEAALTLIQDWLHGFEIIKNFSVEKNIFKKFDVVNGRSMDAMFINSAWTARSQLLTSLMSYLSYFAIIALSALLVMTKEFSAGDFFVAIGMIDQLSYPLISLAGILQALIAIRPSCRSMEEFLLGKVSHTGASRLKKVDQEIQYQSVTFSFPDLPKPILRDLTFTLKKGGRYLLRGPSGCGKTTAVNLLLCYYDTDSGRIVVDGVPLSRYDCTYDCITVVRQEAVLFHDSLRNNLTLYCDIPDGRLFSALHAVKLDRFANRNALDSIIAENGANLSGGEKKRVCLARALLRETDVLILDEPLANLDSATASEIEDLLLSVEDKILLVVSHQFSPDKIQKFDAVIDLARQNDEVL